MLTEQVVTLITDADVRRKAATAELDQDRRGDLGQFLTPSDVARFMASMFCALPGEIRLLDAGAGSGSLTAAFVEEACSRAAKPHRISATTFEVDPILVPHLREALAHCGAACRDAGVEFENGLWDEDFIAAAVDALGGAMFGEAPLSFNASILNPPYRKIATYSHERSLLQTVGLDATNLYAAFVALAIRLLEPDGQMVVIIPRSFCNGPYFRPFRAVLLDETAIRRIHVFDSRADAFKDDAVLQENVILHLVKTQVQATTITISSSAHATAPVQVRELPYDEVVHRANGDRFIHVPTKDGDEAIAAWMASLPSTLESLGLTVSTGRVVDFRADTWIRQDPDAGTVPLVYPCHFEKGVVSWPKPGARKPNAILREPQSEDLLVPAGFYVLTKRFSSKEERRRVVAAVFDPEMVGAESVGFENHLNYFHCRGRGLGREVAYGLATFLNSTAVDRYFRQFNGHTQVNATDLRTFRFPDRSSLVELGKRALEGKPVDQEQIDAAIEERFPLSPGAKDVQAFVR
jgi:adenine-specific DNA-methyltransferase